MVRRFLGQVILLRHGQSEYTNIYPDITYNGVKTIVNSANLIKSLLNGDSNVVIITSPMIRAKGSADIIAKIIEYRGKIKEVPAIGGAIVKNKKQGRAIFDEYMAKGGIRALDKGYGTDPRYEKNPSVIEPRSEIRKRFFEYFAKLIVGLLQRQQLWQQPPLHLICVSHYETLYYFVEHLFKLDYTKDEPLGHGEIIVVSVFDLGIKNTSVVEIEVTFRKKRVGKIGKKFFDYEKRKII